MNILEHIKAGHYPKDAQGRPMIRRAPGASDIFVISTDGPPSAPIVCVTRSALSAQTYTVDGEYAGNALAGAPNTPSMSQCNLLPPEKVAKTVGFAVYDTVYKDFDLSTGFETRDEAARMCIGSTEVVVELKAEVYPT